MNIPANIPARLQVSSASISSCDVRNLFRHSPLIVPRSASGFEVSASLGYAGAAQSSGLDASIIIVCFDPGGFRGYSCVQGVGWVVQVLKWKFRFFGFGWVIGRTSLNGAPIRSFHSLC